MYSAVILVNRLDFSVRVRAKVYRVFGSSRFRCSVMEEPNWKEVVLQSLEQRDARELFSADIYEACILSDRPY